MKTTAIIVSRNDNYGGHLSTRASYCLCSMIETFDEVIYVDWNSPERSLIEEIRANIPATSRFKHIIVTPMEAQSFLAPHTDAQECCEVLGRNIAIRRATGDIIVSTNIDIIAPSRETLQQFLKSKAFNPRRFVTIARCDVPRDVITNYQFDQVPSLQHHLASQHHVYPQRHKYHWTLRMRLDRIHGRVAFNSIIECCGDFQIAHRDLWHDIRGFEESMFRRMGTDTFVQKKARQLGYQLRADLTLPVFHIEHGSGDGGKHTDRPKNDADHYFSFNTYGENHDNWGFADRDIPIEII